MKLMLFVAMAVLCGSFAGWAQTSSEPETLRPLVRGFSAGPNSAPSDRPFHFELNLPKSFENENIPFAANRVPALETDALETQATASRPKTFNYTKGYATRRKIHKYASIATLPLAVSEAIVGQKLIDSRSDSSLRSAHSALAAGIGVLFGVESVTGVWNLWDARKLSKGRSRRLVHGILMLAADAGFVATAALAPHHEDDGGIRSGDASAHRAVAYASFGVATTSYLYMLFTK